MTHTRTILLVDDSPLFLALEKSFFEDLPYRVLTAGGGQEGLRLFREERPDVVLLDEDMPDVPGHEVLERMRQERDREVPVILVTGTSDDSVIERCMRAGLSDYIKKPFEAEDLLRKVGKAIGLPERKLVSFLVRVRSGGPWSFAKAVDLSQGGMRIETREPLELGSEVELEFFLPGTKVRLQPKASVVRKMPPSGGGSDWSYGLRFAHPTEAQRAVIASSLRSR